VLSLSTRRSVQAGLDGGPGPVGLPAREPLVHRLPRPVPLRQIPPRHPAAGPAQDAGADLPVPPPAPAPLRGHRWQQGRQPRPLLVGELESPVHARLLPHHLPSTQTHPPIQETPPTSQPEIVIFVTDPRLPVGGSGSAGAVLLQDSV